MRAAKEELRQAEQIVAGKPFMLRRKVCDPKFALLDGMWSVEDTYLDLAASAADATKFFEDQKDHEEEKLFWSQFSAPTHPLLLNEQMAE